MGGRESATADRGRTEFILSLGALIMLGTLFGLIVLIFGLVRRYDTEA